MVFFLEIFISYSPPNPFSNINFYFLVILLKLLMCVLCECVQKCLYMGGPFYECMVMSVCTNTWLSTYQLIYLFTPIILFSCVCVCTRTCTSGCRHEMMRSAWLFEAGVMHGCMLLDMGHLQEQSVFFFHSHLSACPSHTIYSDRFLW